MSDDPWLNPPPVAPVWSEAVPVRPLAPCWRCERESSTTYCRVCHRPLCADCRIDHYHEGYP